MALDILKPCLRKTINFRNCTILPTFYQNLQHIFGRSRVLEAFVFQKLNIANEKKFGSYDTAAFTPLAQLDENDLVEMKRNNLAALAIYALISRDYQQLLTQDEQEQCKRYMDKIRKGHEKSGIVEGVQGGVPMFIHRMLAEYLAAYYIFKNRNRREVQLYLKSKSYWKFQNTPVRRLFDEIAIRDNDGNDIPVHLAIILGDKDKLKAELKKNVDLQRDAIGRTPLLLAVQYSNKMGTGRYDSCWRCLEAHLEEMKKKGNSHVIDAKDSLLHWSALDYAFRIGNSDAIRYLLQENASMNAIPLLEQIQERDPGDTSEALAQNDTYLMDFAYDIDKHEPLFPHSEQQIETMRTVCNMVVTHLKNNHREWFEVNKTNILLMCAKTDSVLLLKSLLASETELFTASNQTSVITEALNECSFHVLGFLIYECKIDISRVIVADHVYNLLKSCVQNRFEKWFAYFLNFSSFLSNIMGSTLWDWRMLEILFDVFGRKTQSQSSIDYEN